MNCSTTFTPALPGAVPAHRKYSLVSNGQARVSPPPVPPVGAPDLFGVGRPVAFRQMSAAGYGELLRPVVGDASADGVAPPTDRYRKDRTR